MTLLPTFLALALLPVVAGVTTLKVFNKEESPYLTKNGESRSGFLIDLTNKLEAELKGDIKFNWEPQAESYGAKESGAWTGMMGQLVTEESGIIIAPFTVSAARIQDVTFLQPFMNADVQLLANVGSTQLNGLEASAGSCLLKAFHWSVWLCVVLATLLTIGVLTFLVWLSGVHGDALQFCLGDSTWFLLSALTLQGHEGRTPKSCGAKVLVVFWWLFCIWLLIGYIGALSGTMSAYNNEVLLTLEDVEKNTELTPYCVTKGTTFQLLENSKLFTGRLKTVGSPKDGAQKVKEDPNAVFLGERNSLISESNNMDDLIVIPTVVKRGHYAMAMHKNSDAAVQININVALMKLEMNGELTALEKRWWPQKDIPRPMANALTLIHASPIFIVLLIGLLAAVVIAAVQRVRNGPAKRDEPKNHQAEAERISLTAGA